MREMYRPAHDSWRLSQRPQNTRWNSRSGPGWGIPLRARAGANFISAQNPQRGGSAPPYLRQSFHVRFQIQVPEQAVQVFGVDSQEAGGFDGGYHWFRPAR